MLHLFSAFDHLCSSVDELFHYFITTTDICSAEWTDSNFIRCIDICTWLNEHFDQATLSPLNGLV